MNKYYLKPRYVRKKQNESYKRVEENVTTDLVKRCFNVDKKNKIWVIDITYLIWNNRRLYLSTILDLYDRKVVSYQISNFNNNQLVIDTLKEAIAKRKDVRNLIIHSNHEYKAICESNGIQRSMSRKGTPLDDEPMESFHSILKKETLYNNNISSLQEYRSLV